MSLKHNMLHHAQSHNSPARRGQSPLFRSLKCKNHYPTVSYSPPSSEKSAFRNPKFSFTDHQKQLHSFPSIESSQLVRPCANLPLKALAPPPLDPSPLPPLNSSIVCPRDFKKKKSPEQSALELSELSFDWKSVRSLASLPLCRARTFGVDLSVRTRNSKRKRLVATLVAFFFNFAGPKHLDELSEAEFAEFKRVISQIIGVNLKNLSPSIRPNSPSDSLSRFEPLLHHNRCRSLNRSELYRYLRVFLNHLPPCNISLLESFLVNFALTNLRQIYRRKAGKSSGVSFCQYYSPPATDRTLNAPPAQPAEKSISQLFDTALTCSQVTDPCQALLRLQILFSSPSLKTDLFIYFKNHFEKDYDRFLLSKANSLGKGTKTPFLTKTQADLTLEAVLDTWYAKNSKNIVDSRAS